MSLADAPEPSRSTSAARMQLLRARRRAKLRVVLLEVREREIDELVRRGLLQEADRDDPVALCGAIGAHLDVALGRSP